MNTELLKKYLTVKNLAVFLLLANFLTFTMLLLKNPFSERNLISNLEPYPDTIHYISPALSLIHGKGFNIEREGRVIEPTVPFLYSAILVPLYLIHDDARTFYFTNVLIAMGGALLFYLFLTRVVSNRFIPPLTLFLYVTNYFVYWYPNLAMAENLGLGLFMASIFLLTSKVTTKNIILAGILAVSFYAAKYAYFTLSAVFITAYLIKILLEEKLLNSFSYKRMNIKKYRTIFIFVSCLVISLGVFFLVEYSIRGVVVFQKIQYLLEPLTGISKEEVSPASVNSWFSYTYFDKNFQIYSGAVMGNPMRFLWDFTPLLPKYLAILSLTGLLAGIVIKKYRLTAAYLAGSIVLPILFLSTFYAADARYIFNTIPALLGGLAILLSILFKFLSRKKLTHIFYAGLILIFIFYSVGSFMRIKYQTVLNLKYAETPWNYISVKTFNEFFGNRNFTPDKKPVLITALQPFYIDIFSNGKFKLLPLAKDQEFTNNSTIVWGEEDYSDFIGIYRKYLRDNREVFVTNASLGNEGYLYLGYDRIKDNFNLELVHKGCLDTCNIYKLKEKQE